MVYCNSLPSLVVRVMLLTVSFETAMTEDAMPAGCYPRTRAPCGFECGFNKMATFQPIIEETLM